MLQVGIVGLPNVGKSTLFKTLTKKPVPCENFPFCTIEPNVGIVEVPDERLRALSKKSASQKTIPAVIEFVDIAGLVAGAHKGEGLGNKFLANIREVDMIAHVVRAFKDPNVHHVNEGLNPLRDVEIIELELAMADLETVQKRLDNLTGKMKAGKTREMEIEHGTLTKILAAIQAGKPAREVGLDEEEQKIIKGFELLTLKPVLYILNVDEENAINDAGTRHGASLPLLGPDRLTLPLSVKIESEIMEMPAEEQTLFLESLGLKQSGLDRMIVKCYELLNLITYFTSGEKESRAWTVRNGAKAPEAAGVIHTDFERAFICAEIINWKDFVDLGEAGAKEAGKMHTEGKQYIMKDGDTCYFKVGV